jgi:hypothetical protein
LLEGLEGLDRLEGLKCLGRNESSGSLVCYKDLKLFMGWELLDKSLFPDN